MTRSYPLVDKISLSDYLYAFSDLQASRLDPWSLSPLHVFKVISSIAMCALAYFQQRAACRVVLGTKKEASPQGKLTHPPTLYINVHLLSLSSQQFCVCAGEELARSYDLPP
jgi:hypothetical protein